MKHYIAPSLLAANKDKLGDEIKLVEMHGAEYLHWDIMDGHFVTNTSFSLKTVQEHTKIHKMINDVHIMVVDPEIEAFEFIDAGADVLTFHYEACKDAEQCATLCKKIRARGVKAGVSIKPNTPCNVLFDIIDDIDLVLVMSVEPGLGGQKFMPCALDKIKALRQFIDAKNIDVVIEVDGGINAETGPLCRAAGADILVAGSYLFGHDDIKERMRKIR